MISRVVATVGLILIGVAGLACVSTTTETKKVSEDKQAMRFYRLAQVEFDQGKNQEALDHLKKSLELDPKNAEIHSYLGVVYLYLSEYANSEKELGQALKLNPYLTDARNSLGAVYMKTGRPDKAVAAFEECLKDKTYPSPEKILYNLGTLQLDQKQVDRALATFNQAVNTNASYARGYYGLGLTLLQMGRKEEARASLQKVITLEPNSAEAAKAREILGLSPGATKG